MRKKFGLRSRVAGLTVLAAAAAVMVFFAVGAFATGSGTGCPSLSGKQTSTDINAYLNDNGGGNATYFIDTPSDSSSGGVPGLIQYCVTTSVPYSAAADYTGWTAVVGTSDFAFGRPDGNPSNLPFDGATGVDVGNATWNSGTVPTDQTILLHINDPAECNALYRDGSQTCWVFPNGTPTTPAADLQVTKTATASFTRDYDWSVVKAQLTSATAINSSASTVNVNYRVRATWTGPTDSGWQVTGNITVTNPNGFDVTGVTITDAVDNGGLCSVSDTNAGLNETVPADDALVVPYSCSYTSAPSPAAGSNTATATWDKDAFNTPTGTASNNPVAFDFSTVTPTVTHACTTVTDTWSSTSTATVLGRVCQDGTTTSLVYTGSTPLSNFVGPTYTATSPANTWTFTYTRSVPVVANTCTKYDNSASISSDATSGDNTSSASVTVCGPVTGGLTIGFWSNNNGKAILCKTSAGAYVNYPAWVNILNGTSSAPYNVTYLRNANGSSYTVPSTSCNAADSSFATWLLNASATNMSFMLSAQLAGTILNITYNGMNGGTCIAGIDGNPITINGLIANAITFLHANGITIVSGSLRNTATLYKNIFDTLNNGKGFAVSCV